MTLFVFWTLAIFFFCYGSSDSSAGYYDNDFKNSDYFNNYLRSDYNSNSFKDYILKKINSRNYVYGLPHSSSTRENGFAFAINNRPRFSNVRTSSERIPFQSTRPSLPIGSNGRRVISPIVSRRVQPNIPLNNNIYQDHTIIHPNSDSINFIGSSSFGSSNRQNSPRVSVSRSRIPDTVIDYEYDLQNSNYYPDNSNEVHYIIDSNDNSDVYYSQPDSIISNNGGRTVFHSNKPNVRHHTVYQTPIPDPVVTKVETEVRYPEPNVQHTKTSVFKKDQTVPLIIDNNNNGVTLITEKTHPNGVREIHQSRDIVSSSHIQTHDQHDIHGPDHSVHHEEHNIHGDNHDHHHHSHAVSDGTIHEHHEINYSREHSPIPAEVHHEVRRVNPKPAAHVKTLYNRRIKAPYSNTKTYNTHTNTNHLYSKNSFPVHPSIKFDNHYDH